MTIDRLTSAVRSAAAHRDFCLAARNVIDAEIAAADATTAADNAASLAAEIRLRDPSRRQAARELANEAGQAQADAILHVSKLKVRARRAS